jgi:ketosteroid isomerase-like protein
MRSFEKIIETSKAEVTRLYQNPNTRYAMIGIVGALIILLFLFIGLQLIGKSEPIGDFVKRWQQAVESKQMAKYQALWDTKARRENRVAYERALKLVMKEQVEADLAGIEPEKDFRNQNRYRIRQIPVTFYEDEVMIRLYRNLTAEKKGLSRKWKLINDEIRGEPEYPAPSEEPIVEASDPPATPEITPSAESSEVSIADNPARRTVEPDVSTPFAGNAPIDTQLKVRQVLGNWQTAWQEKDLDMYMSTYADEAEITRVTVRDGKEYPITLTKAELRTKMRAINEKYSKIEVIISNVQVNGDSAVADVGFLQKFVGTPASGSRPAYSDYGTKKLILMVDANDGFWKIYSESWKLYEGVPEYPKL